MLRRGFLALVLLARVGSAGEGVAHHDLHVRLEPKEHAIEVADRTSLRRFRVSGDLFVEDAGKVGSDFCLIRLKGTIHHPPEAQKEEYARSFSETPGTISEEGVFLSGSSGWYPVAGDELVTFTLEVDLPKDWDAVSEGVRTRHEIVGHRRIVTWECKDPVEEIHLVAGPYTEYARGNALAFLRAPDPTLAAKYLEVTGPYIDMYSKLLGPYPFGKFALVENFWETGYGMPSFTLLGPQVIRFPFILHSSYPHEILHNWWGNGVYVDRSKGNWCEGLTAYLADHLIKEGQGKGDEYRRDALAKYRAYVRGSKDFSLRDFRERHSAATEAVGYGKALMVFHMLRIRLGDAKYTEALRAFYRDFRFKRASWDDLAAVFGRVAGEDLSRFFRQWIDRTGAPALAIRDGRLVQTQPGEPYELRVNVQVDEKFVQVDMKEASVELPRGNYLAADPQFDLFRLLDRKEVPVTLGDLFGAEKVLLVLPDDIGPWKALADAWKVETVRESEIEALPKGRCIWIAGEKNRWAKVFEVGPVSREPQPDLSFALCIQNPDDPELAIGWIGSRVPEAVPGLARKLPHYGKYSYVMFKGGEPTNTSKGHWSDVAWKPTPEPLARLATGFDTERLMTHVRFLADDKLKGRGNGTPELDEAAEYIAKAFQEAGLAVTDDRWEEEGGPGGRKVTLRNVIAVIPGTNEAWKDQCVVVGAHYDHLGLGWPDVRKGCEGQIHNGADDNASGVAVLLELGRALAESKPLRTIVLVAFAGEEWGLRGSRRFVKTMTSKPTAMVNMDCVGRLEVRKPSLFGAETADEWQHIAMGVGYTTGVEVQSVPKDPGGSDQVAFHEAGIPAIQLFTGAHGDYHAPTDDVEKIDAKGMVKIAMFVRETVVYLAEREQPLTAKGAAPAAGGGEGRKVSLGTVPDFGFEGPGVRVQSVVEGSPAAKAGVEAGDLLLAIDAAELKTLGDMSKALKAHAPGDVVKLRIRRGAEEITLEATLVAR